ncbi:MAG: hypothetical protein ACFFED_15310 [Candidatus Thorarchaeota archaeon]
MLFGRSKDKPIIKKLKKIQVEIEKGKMPKLPETQSRQDIISSIFSEDLASIGLQASSDSGYIPSSQTPLAKYLRRFGVSDDIIDAILTGLGEEETAKAVRDVIEAAADTPDIDMHGEYLERAKELAVEEWKKRRQIETN